MSEPEPNQQTTSAPVIDVHAHYLGVDLIETVERDGAKLGVELRSLPDGKRLPMMSGRPVNQPLLPALSDTPARVSAMDAAGIDIQVVSSWMEFTAYNLEPDAGAAFARLQNESLQQLVRSDPRRYVACGTLPMQAPDLAVRELQHCVKTLNIRAVQLGTNVEGRTLDEPEFDAVWRAAEAMQVLVFLHPHQAIGAERMKRYFLPLLVGYPADTTLAAASLILGGVFDRFPRLRVCLAHGGGFLPYQIGRLDRGYSVRADTKSGADRPPSDYFAGLYFDSIVHDNDALAFLLKKAGPAQVVLGSDYPFNLGEDHPVARLDKMPDLDDADRALVLGGNLRKLLDI